MRSGIIIALLSTLLYWGQAVPAPQHHQAGLPQHGMFPRVQTVYNRPPPGFFFFPSWESLMFTTPSSTPTETPLTGQAQRGFLIAGGESGSSGMKSAEIFNPVTGNSCPVGDLTMARNRASMCNNMICGGVGSQRSCDMFDGSYSFTRLPVTLEEDREGHLCWGLKSGEVILLGSSRSKKTTERVSADGSSSSADFSLRYDTHYSCGIDLGDHFVVTGGWPDTDTVTRYSETGFDQDLAKLKQGRSVHACTKFVDGSGKTALLVTGGYDPSRLSSTEIYLESTSTWSFAAALPSRRSHLSAATLDNSVFVFGGYKDGSGSTNEILSYNSTSDSWDVEEGQMTKPRHGYGLGLHIEVSKVCP